MKIGVFVFQKKENQGFPPSHYGYHAIRWAFETSKASIETLKNKESSKDGLISKITSYPFPAEVQYMALSVAAYVFYAIQICRAPEVINNDLNKGIDDGIKDLRGPEGAPYDKEMEEFFKSSFAQYYRAQLKDIEADPRHFNVDGSNVAKTLVDMLSLSYQHKINDPQEQLEVMMVINTSAGAAVSAIYTTLKEELGLKYRPS